MLARTLGYTYIFAMIVIMIAIIIITENMIIAPSETVKLYNSILRFNEKYNLSLAFIELHEEYSYQKQSEEQEGGA